MKAYKPASDDTRKHRTIDSLKSKGTNRGEDIHARLFNLMKEKNLPDPEVKEKIWFREIAAGLRRAGIPEEFQRKYAGLLFSKRSYTSEQLKLMSDLNLIDKYWCRAFPQKKLSKQYDPRHPLFILFADFVVLSKEAWVIEGKEELNYEAIGQVLVYKDLLEEDYPQLGRLRMGIICFEGDERLESTCKGLGIEVFKLG